jgi:hypothetical protein
VEDEYIGVLESIGKFMNQFHIFSNSLSNRINKQDLECNKDLMKQFVELNDKCNQLEDTRIKNGILGNEDYDSI